MSRKSPRDTKESRAGSTRRGNETRGTIKPIWLTLAVVALAVLGVGVSLDGGDSTNAPPTEFTDVKAQTKEFIDYYNTIELTPEQELVKREALSAIKAPCCSDNTAYTCCCPCNMAKSWWGLSHHLIADEGYGAEEVRASVEEWIDFINPNGFSGDACYTGGCARPFHRNGCGGMDENHLVF